VVHLLSMCDEPVERRGMEYMLRLIHARLDPAQKALDHYRPKQ